MTDYEKKTLTNVVDQIEEIQISLVDSEESLCKLFNEVGSLLDSDREPTICQFDKRHIVGKVS